MPRRVLVAAGGTGGHFYPGLVLAQTLERRGWQPLMLVRKDDPALPTLEREGIAACEAPLRGMPRRLGLPLLGFAGDLLRTLRLVSRVVRDFDPALVVGMGGYLTFPAVAAAARRGVPRAVHESNATLGLANRAAAACSAALFWGLPPASGAGSVTGTPIRQTLWSRGDAAASRRKLGLDAAMPTVLVFGGSQGARGLNRALPKALAAAAKGTPGGLQAIHLAGPCDGADVVAAYREGRVPAKVLPFLDDIELAYAAADLAVCRAGASTLAELAAERLPAVFVPFPAATGRHQEINARVVERAGACRVVLEPDLDCELAGVLGDLLSSQDGAAKRRAMAQAYDALGLPKPEQCASALADAVENLSEKAPNSRL